MEIDAVELHDAVLRNTAIDYMNKTVEIELEFYASSDDPSRRAMSIVFEGVKSISQISNMDRLEQSSSAGNINYWLPEQHSGGTTYIYLSDGCIEIKANGISLKT